MEGLSEGVGLFQEVKEPWVLLVVEFFKLDAGGISGILGPTPLHKSPDRLETDQVIRIEESYDEDHFIADGNPLAAVQADSTVTDVGRGGLDPQDAEGELQLHFVMDGVGRGLAVFAHAFLLLGAHVASFSMRGPVR